MTKKYLASDFPVTMQALIFRQIQTDDLAGRIIDCPVKAKLGLTSKPLEWGCIYLDEKA